MENLQALLAQEFHGREPIALLGELLQAAGTEARG
jgi:hypothetical protein